MAFNRRVAPACCDSGLQDLTTLARQCGCLPGTQARDLDLIAMLNRVFTDARINAPDGVVSMKDVPPLVHHLLAKEDLPGDLRGECVDG